MSDPLQPQPLSAVPAQVPVPWGIVFAISWRGLKRRFLRSLITMVGVVLAIAFLAYMLTTGRIVGALVNAHNDDLNVLLQNAGVDILVENVGTDRMTILLLCLALLTSMAGIINSMLMSVTERVREIGTLKCLGARDKFIVQAYFVESSLQGICGSVIGMLLGFLVAMAVTISNYGGFTFRYMPVFAVLGGLLISLLAGSAISILAAIAPAYIAARKQPIEALRVEE